MSKQQGDSWPLGELIRKARGNRSMRDASMRAGLSDGVWRNVESGRQPVGGAVDIPARPRPRTVAVMCWEVGIDVSEGLRLAGYDPDHHPELLDGPPFPTAKQLREDLEGREAEARRATSGALLPDRYARWFSRLPASDRDQIVKEVQRLSAELELDDE